jgi:hypothetical protein
VLKAFLNVDAVKRGVGPHVFVPPQLNGPILIDIVAHGDLGVQVVPEFIYIDGCMEGAIPVVNGDELFGDDRPVSPVTVEWILELRGTIVHHLRRDGRFAWGRRVRHRRHRRLRERGVYRWSQRWRYRGRKTNQGGWGVNRIIRVSERNVVPGPPGGRVLNPHAMTDVGGVTLNADQLTRTLPVLKTVLNPVVQVVIYNVPDTNISPVSLVVGKGTFEDLTCFHSKEEFSGPVQNFYRFCSRATGGFRGR